MTSPPSASCWWTTGSADLGTYDDGLLLDLLQELDRDDSLLGTGHVTAATCVTSSACCTGAGTARGDRPRLRLAKSLHFPRPPRRRRPRSMR